MRFSTVEMASLGDSAATSGSDYNPRSGVAVTIPAGRTQATAIVYLPVHADTLPEHDERFLVLLHDPENAVLGRQQAWGTIVDDDQPVVSVADATASEGAGSIAFTLRLHAAAVHPASVRYTTTVLNSASDTAAAPGEDFTTTSGTVNIAAGDTFATITVSIIGDSVDEPDESFLLELSDPDLLALRDPVAVGTITDDDPGFWVDDRSVRENAATMDFTVTRDHTSAGDVIVNYRVGAAGSARGGTSCTVDGVDFVTPPGTVTMPAAGKEATISVEICNDDDPEGSENLLIELTNVTGRKTTGVGTIVAND